MSKTKVKKEVKEVKVEVKENKVDRRIFNPGRPKSKEAQQQEQFEFDLMNGIPFTVDGLNGEFELIKDSLYQDNSIVGKLLKKYPTKLKFLTSTLIGNPVHFVMKFKDIELK